MADDIDSKCKVIIENQLESTDHKHLGQLLTYASSYDASIIIWLVTGYTEEHSQAINWFNKHISDGISFFLVLIEVYKIGESDPAPKFSIICEPNNWGKTLKKSEDGDTVSDFKLLQLEYWEGLKDFALKEKTSVNYGRTPKPRHYYNISIGTGRCHIALTLSTQKSYLGCEVYIRNDKTLFKKFLDNKDKIEKIIGSKLEWTEIADVSATKVLLTRNGNPKEKTNWPDYYKWSVDIVEKFNTAFKPYL